MKALKITVTGYATKLNEVMDDELIRLLRNNWGDGKELIKEALQCLEEDCTELRAKGEWIEL